MSAGLGHTPHHPRWHRRQVSVWWWLESWRYARFVLRELTSLAVAWWALVQLWLLRCLAQGEASYAAAMERLASPALVACHLVALALVVYHAVTWFNLAPKALVVRLGGRRLPDWVVAGGNYAAWLASSAAVAWLVLGR